MQPAQGAAASLRSVGVIGGGTSGYFAALAIKRRFPQVRVTVVESRSIPIIGVGEATTTLAPPFLHQQLGLDIVELFRAVRPTFKLGIRFEWGLPDPDYYFTYPFGDAAPIEAFALDRDLRTQSLVSRLIGEGRGPIVRTPEGKLLSLLPSLKFAYHLDNVPFVAFLAQAAARLGIEHVDMTVESVRQLPARGGVAAVRGEDGRELQFDFYVDATGFRSLVLDRTLGSPFESYDSSLFCDRAIVANVPHAGPVDACTTAETMNAGWCWRIPTMEEEHRGYVHSSAFLSEDAAVAEMRARNPGMGEPRVVRFRSGRHREFWRGNVACVGNAYGFVEPLESTALHMVILETAYLLEGLHQRLVRPDDGSFADKANEAVGRHWDYLRWFLAVHYRFNRRRDTPFWRAARADVNVSGVSDLLAQFGREGPWLKSEGRTFDVGDPAFNYSGMMMLLLGQHAPGSERARASIDSETWAVLSRRDRNIAARALPHREALEALLADPEMLRGFATARRSWCQAEGALPNALIRDSLAACRPAA